MSMAYFRINRLLSARKISRLTRVARNAPRSRKPTIAPLKAPTSAPTASVHRIASQSGAPTCSSMNKVVKLVSENTEPTLRSTPPLSTTTVAPMATKPNSPNWRAVSVMLSKVR